MEHLEDSPVKGRIYVANVMDAGKIAETSVMEDAYRMGKEL